MRLPLIARSDYRLISEHLPIIHCDACGAVIRRRVSYAIVCAKLGLDLRVITEGRTAAGRSRGNAVGRWIIQATRTGLFDRLTEAGVLSPAVDWQAIARGSYAVHSPYFRGRAMERVLARYASVIESEQLQRRRELAEASCGAGDGFGFGNVGQRELVGVSYRAKRMIRAYSLAGCRGGADALSAMGDDRYAHALNVLASKVDKECLRLARADPEPQARLDGWLAEHHRPREVILAAPAAWLAQRPFTVCGIEASIIQDELDIDGQRFPLEAIDRVPVDRDSLRLVRTLPRMSEPAPF